MNSTRATSIGVALLLSVAGCGGSNTNVETATDMLNCALTPAACGMCLSDRDCSGGTPRCDLTRKTCSACLPENDNCPAGQVCVRNGSGWECGTSCHASPDCIKLAGGGECCGGACHNTQGDVMNCGRCGNGCQAIAN